MTTSPSTVGGGPRAARLRDLQARGRTAGASVFPPLAVYGLSRIVDGVFLARAGATQVPPSATPGYFVAAETANATTGYLQVMSNWDGVWYRLIAEHGYPASLPMAGGQVVQNAWAFYPGYPALVRLAMTVTGAGFPITAGVVSLVLGAAAMVLVHRLVLPAGRFTAFATVACLCAFVAAPVFQVGYSESLAIALVAGSLLALRQQRYGLVLVLGLALSLSRPVVLPLAAVVAVHGLWRWHRERGLMDIRQRMVITAVAGLVALSTALWPVVAGLVTGRADAYLVTQQAWPANQGPGGLWGGWIGLLVTDPSASRLVGTGAILVAIVFVTTRRPARGWGVELRSWAALYPLYILVATRPTPSILRYAMLSIVLVWPFPDARASRRERYGSWVVLGLLVGVGVVAQYFWTLHIFTVQVSPDAQSFP